MTHAELYEVLVLWGAYQDLHEYLNAGDARTSSPGDIVGKVAAVGHDRAAAAIFAAGTTTSLDDAAYVLGELLKLAVNGRRPRYGRELGNDFCAELLSLTHTEGANP